MRIDENSSIDRAFIGNAGHRGARYKPLKANAQGRPDQFGEPVVTMLVCFHHFAREAMGAASTRHSLRPLLSRAVRSNSSGAICAAGMQAHLQQ
jgi:hypothetical protein